MKAKAIVLGAQCSGKTTLYKYLRSNTDMPVFEQDELLLEKNKGDYPSDIDYKHNVLLPQIEAKTISSDNRIHIASYFSVESLKKARENGFRVVVLSVPEEMLKERNVKRMEEQNYDDAKKWLQGELDYMKKIQDQGLVDCVIDGTQPVEEIARFIQEYGASHKECSEDYP